MQNTQRIFDKYIHNYQMFASKHPLQDVISEMTKDFFTKNEVITNLNEPFKIEVEKLHKEIKNQYDATEEAISLLNALNELVDDKDNILTSDDNYYYYSLRINEVEPLVILTEKPSKIDFVFKALE